MPVTVLKQERTNGKETAFINITEASGLSNTAGWWNSIVAGDFDNDGDIDYVAGNLGLNSRYRASEEEAVSLYAKDFDNSGSIDPIMFHYIMGENYPAHPRDALIDQIAFMRGRYPRYAEYGKATFDTFFAEGELADAYVLRSYEFRSSYLENLGNGKFAVKALPNEAQFAPVYGMIPKDYNNDGKLDLLLVGNSYATETHTGRYDAAIGNYLLGDGKGNFKAVEVSRSGFFVRGNAKAMAELSGKDGESLLLVSQHADSLKVFRPSDNRETLIYTPEPTDQRAEVFLKGGRKLRHEFYHGSAYLAQSSRRLHVNEATDSVVVYDYAGKSRTYRFPEGSIAMQ